MPDDHATLIRPAAEGDHDAIWEIFRAVVAGRDAYAFAPDTPRHEGVGYWFGPGVVSFVAERGGRVVGVYRIVENRRDLGAHVANASYMVHPAAAGQGIGRAMGEHSLQQARRLGFDAMQFNFVVSTNRRAVALWQQLGFRIVGTLPKAFRHGTLGLVDAYVMHRFLDDVVPVFGQLPAGETAVARPSAYAVVQNARGEIAIVHGEESVLLPGGALADEETPAAAALREIGEECARLARITGLLGDAVQVVYSRKRGRWFEKRSTFLSATECGATGGRAEHETVWLPVARALDAVTYESHAWALRRWMRLTK